MLTVVSAFRDAASNKCIGVCRQVPGHRSDMHFAFAFAIAVIAGGLALWVLLTWRGVGWRLVLVMALGITSAALVYATWTLSQQEGSKQPSRRDRVDDRPVAAIPYSSCLVYSFPSGKSLLPDFATLPQDPPGCIQDLTLWLHTSNLRQLVLNGHSDRCERDPDPALSYDSNSTLAFRRAQEVLGWLEQGCGLCHKGPMLQPRTVMISSGSRFAKPAINPYLLARDRSVEFRAYWSEVAPPPEKAGGSCVSGGGFVLNEEVLKSGDALNLLAIIVALAAYVAAVGLFMRQRGGDLRDKIQELKSGQEQKSKQQQDRLNDLEDTRRKTRRAIQALALADVPIILAGLLMFLHLFYCGPSLFVTASIVLLTFAACILVTLHAIQWWVATQKSS